MNATDRPVDDFSDLDDNFAEDRAAPRRAPATVPVVQCPRCRGTGQYTYGYRYIQTSQCRVCKGAGKVRADWEKRRAAWQKGEDTRRRNLAERVAQWQRDHAAEWAWMESAADGFEFAREMLNAVRQYGSLTERQLAAVQRCVARLEEKRAEARAADAARSVAVEGGSSIAAALRRATEDGRKAPKIRTEVAHFSLAKATSRNPGCVYVVTPDDVYLGKIDPDGRFQPSRACDDDTRDAVVRISNNALAEAVEYGKRTGRCSCCGRELTDPASIAAGIGPICAAGVV